MKTPITPLVLEHEGSSITVGQDGLTLKGPSIRMNSGSANVGDKILKIGDQEIALGAEGITFNGSPITLLANDQQGLM